MNAYISGLATRRSSLNVLVVDWGADLESDFAEALKSMDTAAFDAFLRLVLADLARQGEPYPASLSDVRQEEFGRLLTIQTQSKIALR